MASCLLVFFKPVDKDRSKFIFKRYSIHTCVASVQRANLTARHRPEHVEDDDDEDDDQQG